MLTILEQHRVHELNYLVEESFASPEDAAELKRLFALDAETFIFVFGSNELGLHGGGAARVALEKYGARYERKGGPGQGFGPQGNSFAIPTCSTTTNSHDHEISEGRLKYYVACFLMYADHNPDLRFQVTQIGCGLAGWQAEVVAPLFESAPDNCYFDTAWHPYLGDKTPKGSLRKYWGHVG